MPVSVGARGDVAWNGYPGARVEDVVESQFMGARGVSRVVVGWMDGNLGQG